MTPSSLQNSPKNYIDSYTLRWHLQQPSTRRQMVKPNGLTRGLNNFFNFLQMNIRTTRMDYYPLPNFHTTTTSTRPPSRLHLWLTLVDTHTWVSSLNSHTPMLNLSMTLSIEWPKMLRRPSWPYCKPRMSTHCTTTVDARVHLSFCPVTLCGLTVVISPPLVLAHR